MAARPPLKEYIVWLAASYRECQTIFIIIGRSHEYGVPVLERRCGGARGEDVRCFEDLSEMLLTCSAFP